MDADEESWKSAQVRHKLVACCLRGDTGHSHCCVALLSRAGFPCWHEQQHSRCWQQQGCRHVADAGTRLYATDTREHHNSQLLTWTCYSSSKAAHVPAKHYARERWHVRLRSSDTTHAASVDTTELGCKRLRLRARLRELQPPAHALHAQPQPHSRRAWLYDLHVPPTALPRTSPHECTLNCLISHVLIKYSHTSSNTSKRASQASS